MKRSRSVTATRIIISPPPSPSVAPRMGTTVTTASWATPSLFLDAEHRRALLVGVQGVEQPGEGLFAVIGEQIGRIGADDVLGGAADHARGVLTALEDLAGAADAEHECSRRRIGHV